MLDDISYSYLLVKNSNILNGPALENLVLNTLASSEGSNESLTLTLVLNEAFAHVRMVPKTHAMAQLW